MRQVDQTTMRPNLPLIAAAPCWKCLDGRTRSHHWRCPKRGNREQSNEALRRWMLDRATRAMQREATPVIATSAGLAVSRTRRMMDGTAGIMADVVGMAARQMQ